MGTLSEEVRTEVICGRICDLEAENAKLRELCADMYMECGRGMGYDHPLLEELRIETNDD